ncbi:extracellular solute-binding protein [Paenibacillus hemerocallicola]|uniref:Extracellular solute-binding protein n=1 Tax=Paenibacillus hemerocallicola TaxID=1172614 RepID=A0A5C4T7S1_9BACL|nr:extracellular solute-binding protein [Paenibacillus hemerocallicola]TNJ64650.1 extracellular solute-binding protein [Paenibacillus hemerocallicola]
MATRTRNMRKRNRPTIGIKSKWTMLSVVALAAVALSACGGKEAPSQSAEAPAAAAPPQPVTLTIAGPAVVWTDAEFTKYVDEPIRKKYPHITLKRIDTTAKGQTIQDLVAANQTPDIYAVQQGNMGPLLDLQLVYDATELIKKHKIDLARIQPELLEAPKPQFGLAYLPGLPVYQSTWVMAYNKSVFNRFGVPFPKDGMTWNETAEIAKKLTRSDQGIQYYGLSLARTYTDAYKQVSVPFADFATNQPMFQAQGWKDLLQFWSDFHRSVGSPPSSTDWNKAWTQEKRIGMRTIQTAVFQELLADKDLEFDVVTFPQNAKVPGMGAEMNAHWWTITKQSPNKDAAIQALSVLLSDEVQTAMTRGMRLTVLKDASIQSQTGADITGTQGKNVTAFTKLKNPTPIRFGNLTTPFLANMNKAFNSVMFESKDINTALREADEQMGKDIQADLKK